MCPLVAGLQSTRLNRLVLVPEPCRKDSCLTPQIGKNLIVFTTDSMSAIQNRRYTAKLKLCATGDFAVIGGCVTLWGCLFVLVWLLLPEGSPGGLLLPVCPRGSWSL